jgi:membrane protein
MIIKSKNKVIDCIIRLIHSVIDNDFFGMAAEMGFMLVIGIFPFMLFLMSIFGWMGNKSLMEPVLLFLAKFMPEQAMNLIMTVLSEVMIFSQGGIMAIIGFVATTFLSMNAMAVVLKGLNRAYKVKETRNLIYTRILSLMMILVDVMVLFLSINLIIFGKIIIGFLYNHGYISETVALVIMIGRWLIAFAALFLMAFLSYYILPDVKGNEKFKRKSAIPGSFFFVIFWLVASLGFSIYVNNLRTYNMVYGTIGAFAVLMIWLYYTSILILIGGELNSQTYNRLSEKADEIQAGFDALQRKS